MANKTIGWSFDDINEHENSQQTWIKDKPAKFCGFYYITEWMIFRSKLLSELAAEFWVCYLYELDLLAFSLQARGGAHEHSSETYKDKWGHCKTSYSHQMYDLEENASYLTALLPCCNKMWPVTTKYRTFGKTLYLYCCGIMLCIPA